MNAQRALAVPEAVVENHWFWASDISHCQSIKNCWNWNTYIKNSYIVKPKYDQGAVINNDIFWSTTSVTRLCPMPYLIVSQYDAPRPPFCVTSFIVGSLSLPIVDLG